MDLQRTMAISAKKISDLLLSVTRIHPVVKHKFNRESLLLGVKDQGLILKADQTTLH